MKVINKNTNSHGRGKSVNSEHTLNCFLDNVRVHKTGYADFLYSFLQPFLADTSIPPVIRS